MAAALPWSRWHQFARLVLGSRRRGPPILPPGLLASWRERLRRVRGLLAREPQATMSWYWRTHERVLDFMLKRYAARGGSWPAPDAAAPEAPPAAETGEPSRAQPGPARTLPAELVPGAAPLHRAPEPEVAERARTHLHDIAVANVAAEKPPPPAFVPPRRWAAAPRPLPRRVTWSPWLIACLIGGALLLQVPIIMAGFVLGRPVPGIGIGLAIVGLAIIVALDHRAPRATPETPVVPRPLGTCRHCGYDLRDIPPGRCPECGGTT